jgi:hypothetical protein
MNEILAIWAEWIKPSAGLPTVQWSILLAVAAAAGHLLNRYTGMPKVVGYSLVGGFAGLAGFTGAVWPLQGTGLFLLELGVAVVLFEAGGRIPLRWFRHNPMVLVQSLAESSLTFIFVYWALSAMSVREAVAEPLALLAMAASPAVLSRVAIDTRAAGPVTERAMVLSTLSTLYALTLCSARAGMMHRPESGVTSVLSTLYPVLVVLGLSVVVGAVLALTLRAALRVMSPTSENTAILAAGPDCRGRRAGGPLRRLGAAGRAAGRHAAQAAQPAPLVMAAADGHGLVHADHADVCAGLGGGGAGRLERPGDQPRAGAGHRPRGRQDHRRGHRQCGQRRELEAGPVGGLRDVADVVRRLCWCRSLWRPQALWAARLPAWPCPPSC